jgi:hypothetical protein
VVGGEESGRGGARAFGCLVGSLSSGGWVVGLAAGRWRDLGRSMGCRAAGVQGGARATGEGLVGTGGWVKSRVSLIYVNFHRPRPGRWKLT